MISKEQIKFIDDIKLFFERYNDADSIATRKEIGRMFGGIGRIIKEKISSLYTDDPVIKYEEKIQELELNYAYFDREKGYKLIWISEENKNEHDKLKEIYNKIEREEWDKWDKTPQNINAKKTEKKYEKIKERICNREFNKKDKEFIKTWKTYIHFNYNEKYKGVINQENYVRTLLRRLRQLSGMLAG